MHPTSARVKVVIAWTLASALGWAVGLGLLALVPNDPLGCAVAGYAIAVAEWLILSRRCPMSRWWILSYGAGWMAAIYLGFFVFENFVPNFPLIGIGGGTLAGLQHWIGCRKYVRHCGWWIPTFGVSTFLGCWFGTLVGVRVYEMYHPHLWLATYVAGGASGGATMGVLSGAVLAGLFGTLSGQTDGK
jgi:hypothetical protein